METMISRLQRTARASAWAVLLLAVFVLVVWAASGSGSFWPVWVWLPTGLLVASGWWAARSKGTLAGQVGQSALVALFLIGVWAASDSGSFWPVWPIAVLALITGLRLVTRGAANEARVEELTVSRAGAV